MGIGEKEYLEIEGLAKLLIGYLKDNCQPCIPIVTTQEGVAIIETVQSTPADCIG